MDNEFRDSLDNCLKRMSQGEAVEACLAEYPSLRGQLESLLNIASSISATPKASPSEQFRITSKARLAGRLREEAAQVKARRTWLRLSDLSFVTSAWQKLLQAITVNKRVAIAVVSVSVVVLTGGLFLSVTSNHATLPSVLASNCTLSVISGNVEIQSSGSDTWESGIEGATLEAGTRVKTDRDSQALLTFFEGSTIKLMPDTDIEIQQLEYTEESTIIVLKQWWGTTWSRVVEITDPGSKYEIETPAGYAMVRGTYFVTEVNDSTTTRVQVHEGNVAVRAQGHEVSVPAGYEASVELGSEPTEPVPVTNDESSGDSAQQAVDTQEFDNIEQSDAETDQSESQDDTDDIVIDTSEDDQSENDEAEPVDDEANDDSDSVVPSLYTLTICCSEGGSATPATGDHDYAEGTVVDITATPDAGWEFDSWTGDVADSSQATTTVTTDGDKTVTANFSRIMHTLTMQVSGGGSITPIAGDHDYAEGTVVDITATPVVGWEFDSWTGDVADPSQASTTVIIDGDKTVTANFVSVPTYTLTITGNDEGSVTQPGEGVFVYNTGTVVNLLAVPDTGYIFYKWEGDKDTIADDHAASTTITMNDDYTINAKYKGGRTLTVTSTIGGSVVLPGESIYSYDKNTVVNLEAVADTGYVFVNWTGDVDEVDDINAASTTVKMKDDYVITANFVKTYTLTIHCNLGGSVLNPGTGTFVFSQGTIVDLEVIAYLLFTFDGWLGNTDTIEDPSATTTKIHMNGNYNIVAHFIIY